MGQKSSDVATLVFDEGGVLDQTLKANCAKRGKKYEESNIVFFRVKRGRSADFVAV